MKVLLTLAALSVTLTQAIPIFTGGVVQDNYVGQLDYVPGNVPQDITHFVYRLDDFVVADEDGDSFLFSITGLHYSFNVGVGIAGLPGYVLDVGEHTASYTITIPGGPLTVFGPNYIITEPSGAPNTLPDGSSTLSLLGIGMVGLVAIKRKLI